MSKILRPAQTVLLDLTKGRNRTPMKAETATLRNIQAENRRLTSTINCQLEEAKQAHKIIKNKYEELLRDIEAVHWQLDSSQRYISMLEKQLVTMRNEDTRVAALLHPIRKCPEDVLVMIFSHAVRLKEDEWFRVATNLSHVCNRWRTVALQTSFLWTRVHVYMSDALNPLKFFLNRTRHRIGSAPIFLTIENIQEAPEGFIECLGIRRFPHITTLNLWLLSSKNVSQLAQPAFSYARRIDSLSIGGDTGTETQSDVEWDCSCIFRQFPASQRVQLQDLDVLSIGGEDSFPNILELTFNNVDVANLLSQLYRFPNLTTFVLKGVSSERGIWTNPVAHTITLPKLVEREIMSVSDFSWDCISAPLLQRFTFVDQLEKVLPFIQRHTSLKRLNCDISIDQLEMRSISDTAKEIEDLGVQGSAGKLLCPSTSDDPPPFPCITRLKLYIGALFMLPLSDFECLVENRCLRSERRSGQGTESGLESWNLWENFRTSKNNLGVKTHS